MTGDLLLRGGRVLLPSGVAEDDVLVRDGAVAAIGEDAVDRAPAGTPELDVAGGIVLPGFQDAHVHPYHAGLDLLRCDLSPYRTVGEYREAIAAYAAAHPEASWIQGGGWSMEAFEGGVPTAAQLDDVTGGRPAFLPNRDGHGAWVSTAALELAGIDRGTADPADGRIERDADGRPVGMLQEGAMGLVSRLLPAIDEATIDEAFLVAQRQLLAWGVTAWQDAMVGAVHGTPDLLDSYLRIADRGELIAHVVGALWWEREQGLEQVPSLLERRDRAGGRERFRATSVKIMQDGVAENFTAAMTEPYRHPHGHSLGDGKSFVDPAVLRDAAVALDAEGFQLHFHALGDRAVRESLDAIAAAREGNGVRDARHHLAHLQVVHPDDVPRFAALGAIANAQPLWAAHEPQMDDLTIPFLGTRRARWQYPFGSLMRAGARIAFGSDWSVSTADPIQIVHTAVNRVAPGGDGPPFLGEQALSLADAITAATHGTAVVNHDEGRSGSIALGLAGDLVVLDRDPFDHPAADFASTRLVATVVGGEVVHEAAA